jgi:ABC-type nitrate/sulfonate/bicarbonate transport system substrate-binding protein
LEPSKLFVFFLVSIMWAASAYAETDKLRVGYAAGMSGQIINVLEKADMAKKHNLDVEYVFFQNGPPMMEAFTSGQLDIAINSLMPLTTYASRVPGSAVIVSALGSSTYAVLVSRSSPAKYILDLWGKRIAVSFGSDSHLDLLISLTQVGIDPNDGVELLNIQPADLLVALEKGTADAIVIRQPLVLKLQQSRGARVLKSWPHRFLVIARSQSLLAHPQAVHRFIDSLADAVAYVRTNPDQAASWFGDRLRVDPSIVKAVSQENLIVSDPDHAGLGIPPDLRDIMASWIQSAEKWGLIKTHVDVDRMFPPKGFIDFFPEKGAP